MEVKKCPICGQKALRNYCEGILQCIECSHGFAKRMPSEAALKRLYSNEYFFGKEYFDYIMDRPALEKNFKDRIKRLSYTYSSKAQIVEVGCAYGFFLNLIKSLVASHQGYEVNPEGVDFAKRELGLNVSNSDFLGAKTPKNSINAIYMWDVIEHLPSPELFIKKASDILKNGGYLALTTGDLGAPLPSLRKGKWRMIHPPTHLHYFTQKSMRLLLKTYNLQIISIRHKALYRNCGSMLHQIAYNRRAKNKSLALFDLSIFIAEKTGFAKLNISLNLGDVMEVVAVKEVGEK